MTEERLKAIELGLREELRWSDGWKNGTQSACPELIAEVRRLRDVIRRSRPFLLFHLNPTAERIEGISRLRSEVAQLCDSWLRPEALSDTGDWSASASEDSGSGAAEPTETTDPADSTGHTSPTRAARPGRPTRSRSRGAK